VPSGYVHGWTEEKFEKNLKIFLPKKYWKLLSLAFQARIWFIATGTELLPRLVMTNRTASTRHADGRRLRRLVLLI
jgi:hypothetical protein